MKAIKKPVEIEFYTWEEVVKLGLETSPDTIHGEGENARAWSFEIHGKEITHHTDECYLVPSDLGYDAFFTVNHVIVVTEGTGLQVVLKEEFYSEYYVKN